MVILLPGWEHLRLLTEEAIGIRNLVNEGTKAEIDGRMGDISVSRGCDCHTSIKIPSTP